MWINVSDDSLVLVGLWDRNRWFVVNAPILTRACHAFWIFGSSEITRITPALHETNIGRCGMIRTGLANIVAHVRLIFSCGTNWNKKWIIEEECREKVEGRNYRYRSVSPCPVRSRLCTCNRPSVGSISRRPCINNSGYPRLPRSRRISQSLARWWLLLCPWEWPESERN